MKLPICLDYASFICSRPKGNEMQDCLSLDGNFGKMLHEKNAFGWKAEEATEEAPTLSDLVNCDPREIVWTSGATESDNLAIK